MIIGLQPDHYLITRVIMLPPLCLVTYVLGSECSSAAALESLLLGGR